MTWRNLRAKDVFTPIDIRSTNGSEELMTVSSTSGVVPRREQSVTMFKAESYVGHKLCWPDDLVVNCLWAWSKGLGVAKHHGIVSSAYGVYRLTANSDCFPSFMNYLLRSDALDREFRVRSKGVWTSKLQLTDDAFLSMPIRVPQNRRRASRTWTRTTTFPTRSHYLHWTRRI